MTEQYRIKPGHKPDLSKFSTDYEGELSKGELKDTNKENIKTMKLQQQKLYAEGKQSLLIVLQALDAGGKDSTIRRVFGKINPQGCHVASFKVPTKEELAHDFLWRIHQHVPGQGMISIFNRSHYEDVLVVRVHDWIDKQECERRYAHINAFEKLLSDYGTRIIKFFLYISKDEQKERFQDRLDEKEKNWKFSLGDLKERKLWEKYIAQFEDVLSHTSSDVAPWYVIPADKKSFRDYLVSTIVRDAMLEMDPQFPPPEEGLDKVVLE